MTKYEFGMDDDYKNSYLSSESGLIFSLKFGIERGQVNLSEKTSHIRILIGTRSRTMVFILKCANRSIFKLLI